jgi:hypothetical protein
MRDNDKAGGGKSARRGASLYRRDAAMRCADVLHIITIPDLENERKQIFRHG